MKGVAALVCGAVLFWWLAAAYSETPQDPQKAVGYFFIAFYCLFFGGFIYGALAFGSMARASLPQRGRAIMLSAIAVFFAGIAVTMVLRHPS